MFRFPEVPQEHALMLKRGGKVKHKTKQTRKTKGKQAVNIKNIITINRGGGGGRGKPSQPAQPRPQYQGIGTLLPFLSMLRPQSNDTRSVSVTSATAGEANNNVMDTIRKSQEITEGKLNARIDDMGSQIYKDVTELTQTVGTVYARVMTPQEIANLRKQQKQQQEQKEEHDDERNIYWERQEARKRGAPLPSYDIKIRQGPYGLG